MSAIEATKTLPPNPELELNALQAYLECSDEIQQDIREMMAICSDHKSDEQERQMAFATIVDALFPNYEDDGLLGMDLEDLKENTPLKVPEFKPVSDALNQEEADFARRLKEVMKAREITQSELAQKIGVSQPAISLMLKRDCRPQKSTVERLAEALEVQPGDLWQDIEVVE